MVKPAPQLLFAIATLAMLCFVAPAFGQVADGLRPPAVPQQESRATSRIPDPAIGEPDTTDKPSGHVLVSDKSLFTDDGWQNPGPSESCDQPCCSNNGPCNCCECGDNGGKRRITADVELMALRTHFSEEVLGKLGERYEMSERITLGIEKPNGNGGRIRYWSYDRTTPNLQGGSSLRADFDVIDFEGTTRFGTRNFDLLLSGGVRWADIKIDIDAGRCRNDMPGGSFGLDLRGLICNDCDNGLVWHSVSGARFSIFGGDWECSHGLIGPTRDDNLTVVELYGGVECLGYCRGHEVYARLVFETQNWRSDSLGEATGIDSIGFVGPGLNLGMNY